MKNGIDFKLVESHSDCYLEAFNERINEVIKVKSESSPKLFCAIVDIPYNQNNEFSIELVHKIKDKYPSLSLDWLLLGEGQMYDYDLTMTIANLKARIALYERYYDYIRHCAILMKEDFNKIKALAQVLQK